MKYKERSIFCILMFCSMSFRKEQVLPFEILSLPQYIHELNEKVSKDVLFNIEIKFQYKIRL